MHTTTRLRRLQVTVQYGPGAADFPYIGKAGWGVASVQCMP
jgi:hypothetical protein